MPERKPAVIMGDILLAISRIQQYTHQVTFDMFCQNFMLAEACLYNLQLMGEAVGRLPNEIKEAYPQVPWTLIKGVRNRLIHAYFGTDLMVVWRIIQEELPSLEAEIESIKLQLQANAS